MSTGKTVLVADDNPMIQKVLRRAFEEGGYQVISALDGAAAIEMARIFLPNLIILDRQMPTMDGRDVLVRLKGDPTLSHLPVVFFTGSNDQTDRVEGLKLGAEEYFEKPFPASMLRSRVDRILERVAAA